MTSAESRLTLTVGEKEIFDIQMRIANLVEIIGVNADPGTVGTRKCRNQLCRRRPCGLASYR